MSKTKTQPEAAEEATTATEQAAVVTEEVAAATEANVAATEQAAPMSALVSLVLLEPMGELKHGQVVQLHPDDAARLLQIQAVRVATEEEVAAAFPIHTPAQG